MKVGDTFSRVEEDREIRNTGCGRVASDIGLGTAGSVGTSGEGWRQGRVAVVGGQTSKNAAETNRVCPHSTDGHGEQS